jgi:hypothetical protein
VTGHDRPRTRRHQPDPREPQDVSESRRPLGRRALENCRELRRSRRHRCARGMPAAPHGVHPTREPRRSRAPRRSLGGRRGPNHLGHGRSPAADSQGGQGRWRWCSQHGGRPDRFFLRPHVAKSAIMQPRRASADGWRNPDTRSLTGRAKSVMTSSPSQRNGYPPIDRPAGTGDRPAGTGDRPAGTGDLSHAVGGPARKVHRAWYGAGST